MLFLLSPAKTLDYQTPVSKTVWRRVSEPLFAAQASQLIAEMRQRSPAQVSALMDLSPALAELNVARYQAWQPQPTALNSKPALLAFNGEVYHGLDATSLNSAGLDWAQQHLVLLSGLYGALRPLDLLQPYRLEMGTALPNAQGKDLYAFWGSTVVQQLNAWQADEPKPLIVNLASQEYAQVVLGRAAQGMALRAPVVDCVFEEGQADGSYKVISFFAKKARGLMARWAIDQRARSLRALQAFDCEGYAWDPAASGKSRLVFRRAPQA